MEAYNETRSRQLWEVEKAWEEPVRQYGRTVGPVSDAFTRDASGTARITNKLNSIIIPRVEFRDATVREAIDFLREQAAENDPSPRRKKRRRYCFAHGAAWPGCSSASAGCPCDSPAAAASPDAVAPPAGVAPLREEPRRLPRVQLLLVQWLLRRRPLAERPDHHYAQSNSAR